jgi:hypothetical protein
MPLLGREENRLMVLQAIEGGHRLHLARSARYNRPTAGSCICRHDRRHETVFLPKFWLSCLTNIDDKDAIWLAPAAKLGASTS